jgi:hypothetical protein
MERKFKKGDRVKLTNWLGTVLGYSIYFPTRTIVKFDKEEGVSLIEQQYLQLLNQNTMQQDIQQQIAVLKKELSELERIASQPQQPSFFSLKTIEQVREKVRPNWFTTTVNGNAVRDYSYSDNGNTPSEADAKSVAAFHDLLCLCAADDSEKKSKVVYAVVHNNVTDELRIMLFDVSTHSPITFKSRESAQHALDNFPHLFKAYLKV